MNQENTIRQYHIGLARGDVARRILLAGDPERVRRFSENLDEIRGEWSCREYLTITGTWKGEEVSLMATGIGASNICLLYTSPSPRDATLSRMPSSA